jgi:hypothetical protein
MPIKVPYNKTDDWMQEYFPEYFDLFGTKTYVKIYPSMPPPSGTYVTGRKTVPEMAPWKYAGGMIDPAGVFYVNDPEDPWRMPWVESVDETIYRAWCDRMNFFRNGGKTANGNPGLDPTVFKDAYMVNGNDNVICPTGEYTFKSVVSNSDNGHVDKELSKEAYFTAKNGEVIWTGDAIRSIRPTFPIPYDSQVATFLHGGPIE